MARSAANAAASVERFFELSLLGLVTSGYLAVLGSGYLDVPSAALMAGGLLLRTLLITGLVRFEIPPRITAVATLAYIGFYPLDYFLLSRDFLQATVHMVFFLALVKILTARTGRDFAFLGTIGFLELLAASVLSASLNFFIFLALFLFFAVATFASSEVRRSMRKPRYVVRSGFRRFHWRLAALTLVIGIGILSLTAGMFFLLPRTAQAAFGRLVPKRYHIPGFSSEISLGEVGEFQQRKTPVMHVRMIRNDIRPNLKWRGGALSQFDGKRWFNRREPGVPLLVKKSILRLNEPREWRPGTFLNYEVRFDSLDSDTLFFAGTPELLITSAPLVIRAENDSFRAVLPFGEGTHYGASGFLDDPTQPPLAVPEPLPAEQRAADLQLPRLDPRITALAASVASGKRGDFARAKAVEQHLRTEYGYTTELLSEEVPDPLANFLFERKKGHCEYFASAMAVMLRTLGIPSRVANGFQSGVFNPVSGWYLIRSSDAHSWVEAYLAGRGWTTFDPTPPDLGPHVLSIWSRMGLYLDAAETFWQEWVLNYDLNRQYALASRVEDSGRSFSARWLDELHAIRAALRAAGNQARQYGSGVLLLLVFCAAAAFCGPRAWAAWKTNRRVQKAKAGSANPSDATILYTRMLKTLGKRGFEKPGWLTPAEFARTLPDTHTAGLVEDFTQAYNDLRFGGDQTVAPRMTYLLDELERPRRTTSPPVP